MALGDKVIVLIDMGAGKVREEVVAAGSAGGIVAKRFVEGGVTVTELTRAGREIRSVNVPAGRLVATIDAPRGR